MKCYFYSLIILVLYLSFSCTESQSEMANKDRLRNYTLAMVQMEVDAGDLDSNLQRAEKKIAEAARNGAQIALLPEAMDLGWMDPSAKTLATYIPEGETCQRLRTAAKQNQIFVCAGIIEKDNDKIYNAAVLIDPSGKVLLKHRKINELDIAHDLYDQGDGLNVAKTALGTIGLYICADANAQDYTLSNSLGYMGADIILSPCVWAVPPDFNNTATPYGDLWQKAYKAVSSRFDLWIAGVSNVGTINSGPWKNWNCIGNSMIYAPGGREILQAPHGVQADTTIYVDIKLKDRPTRGTGWHRHWQ